jgi:fatty-acid desaturase
MTGALIAISIVFIVFVAIAAITLSYHRLQRHRADAVALAGYRRLAEEAAAAQTDIRAQLTSFDLRLAAIEKLLKDIP